MMGDSEHNIQKVFLEVNVNSSRKAYALKDQLEEFLQEYIFPQIEHYFETFKVPSTQELRIDEITLDLDANDALQIDNLSKEIEVQLESFFEASGQDELIQNSNSTAVNGSVQQQIETVLYFLEHGRFPWWVSNPQHANFQMDALLYESLESPYFITQLKELLTVSKAKNRLIRQLSGTFLGLILTKIIKDERSVSFLKDPNSIRSIEQLSRSLRYKVWSFLVDVSLEKSTKSLHSILQKHSNQISELDDSQIQVLESIGEIVQTLQSRDVNNDSDTEGETIVLELDSSESTSEIAFVLSENDEETFEFEIKLEEDTSQPDTNIEVKAQSEADETIEEKVAPSTTENIKHKEQSEEQESKERSENNATSSEVLTEEKEDFHNETTLATQDHKQSDDTSSPHDETEKEHRSSGVEMVSLETGESYYVENAGLVLVHPFLKPFLANCDLLRAGQICDIDLAVHLLHYLATGNELEYEHLQITEKFLCGVPPEFPIDRNTALTSELKEKADELLEAVLGHLPQLKTTSISLLRHEFLQRPGKLILEEANPKLVIERKTQDILLDNLAWNLGLVKLPWHEKMFFVDW